MRLLENKTVVINYKHSNSPGCITSMHTEPYINRTVPSDRGSKLDIIPV